MEKVIKKLKKIILNILLYTICRRNVDKHVSVWIFTKYDLLGGKNMKTVRPRGTDKAEVMQVIKTTSILGRGNEENPVRDIYQYWGDYRKSCVNRISFRLIT